MKITQVLFFVVLAGIALSCNAQGSQEDKQSDNSQVKAEKVQVYYFHTTRRCATCKAVEDVSKQAVKEMDRNNVSFAAYNIEKPEGEKQAKKVGVHGQALLIVGGDKKMNITREGFMYARSKPEKLKEIVQQKINSL
ncbi:MAG: hypothetical protein KGY60_08390 [Bacteroidales bacterium]|nr:hypothetical protein [Bacteroidales bacterium]